MTSTAEFLIQLDAQKSLETLQSCYSQKSLLILKTSKSSQVLRAQIESLLDKKVILKIEGSAEVLDLSESLSIKFNVGTEVFFVKTYLKKFLNEYYFDLSVPVIELKRRKQTRYMIPLKWKQTASLPGYQFNERPLACQVLDLSLSGVRVEIKTENKPFAIDQILEIQFQIHQRAAITCETIVRFFKATPENSQILGLEFLPLNPLQQEKVTSLVDDIKNFVALNKN